MELFKKLLKGGGGEGVRPEILQEEVTGTTGEDEQELAEDEDEEGPEFEASVAENLKDIEAMSPTELLKDAADDIARGDAGEDMDEATMLYTRAAALGNRALYLLLEYQGRPVPASTTELSAEPPAEP